MGCKGCQGAQGPRGLPGGFTEFQSAASEGESTSVILTDTVKLTYPTVGITGGTYQLYYQAEQQPQAEPMSFDVTVDAAVVATSVESDISDFSLAGGMAVVTLAVGAHTIAIVFRTTDITSTATIRRARISLFRVGP